MSPEILDLNILSEIEKFWLCAEGGAGIMSVMEFHHIKLFLSFSDGELYAGVYVDFMGTDSAIFRTLGTKTAMRTDQYNSRWLNGKCPIYMPGFHSVQLILFSYMTFQYAIQTAFQMLKCKDSGVQHVYSHSTSDKQEIVSIY